MTSIPKAFAAFMARFGSPSTASNLDEVTEPASCEIILCVPGDWVDRSDFLRKIITMDPNGRYMFAGMLLVDVSGKDHVRVDFCPADQNLSKAFQIASQGRVSVEILQALADHKSVVYLYFSSNLVAQRERILKFCNVVRRAGGIAVKIESSGAAHSWERWDSLMAGSLFDQYTAVVTLVGDVAFYYSCGMHSFGLPDCEVPTTLNLEDAADLMNRFNFWRAAESPVFSDGHTFSLATDSPRYRLRQKVDIRHERGEPFFNPHGLWRLEAI